MTFSVFIKSDLRSLVIEDVTDEMTIRDFIQKVSDVFKRRPRKFRLVFGGKQLDIVRSSDRSFDADPLKYFDADTLNHPYKWSTIEDYNIKKETTLYLHIRSGGNSFYEDEYMPLIHLVIEKATLLRSSDSMSYTSSLNAFKISSSSNIYQDKEKINQVMTFEKINKINEIYRVPPTIKTFNIFLFDPLFENNDNIIIYLNFYLNSFENYIYEELKDDTKIKINELSKIYSITNGKHPGKTIKLYFINALYHNNDTVNTTLRYNDIIYIPIKEHGHRGGYKNIMYKQKYLKYKQKYLKLKKY
tara:strand:+ start:602 stop:1507 length:906 start_codon:yes stop_codon:yes gene_type:complete